MAEDPDKDELEVLSAKIRQAKESSDAKPKKQEDEKASGGVSKLAQIGTNFVATVIACMVFGWLVDDALGTSPWSLLIMAFVGFVTGFWNMWRTLGGTTLKDAE